MPHVHNEVATTGQLLCGLGFCLGFLVLALGQFGGLFQPLLADHLDLGTLQALALLGALAQATGAVLLFAGVAVFREIVDEL